MMKLNLILLVNFNANDLRRFAMLLKQQRDRPEKFWSERDSNSDLCDAGAVLYRAVLVKTKHQYYSYRFDDKLSVQP